jgi:serine acetyltransferase
VILRGLGARIGRRVFNDGFGLSERSLVTIGDACTLNEMSGIQCHSQEDGTFKSDYSTLGSNVTLGTGSLVHYGVTVGDGAELTTDCFLMKGEQVPPHERWGGNPASEMRVPAALEVRQDRDVSLTLGSSNGSRSAALAGSNGSRSVALTPAKEPFPTLSGGPTC